MKQFLKTMESDLYIQSNETEANIFDRQATNSSFSVKNISSGFVVLKILVVFLAQHPRIPRKEKAALQPDAQKHHRKAVIFYYTYFVAYHGSGLGFTMSLV